MSPDLAKRHLLHANEIAHQAVIEGHHPFGALLVGPDQSTVIIEQINISQVRHAESTLLLRLEDEFEFSPDQRWQCTLVTTVEPCAMCAATMYWSNIGNLVYGMAETKLLALTGNHPENPTMSLPCREIFSGGQKNIKVQGPFEELSELLMRPHHDFWHEAGQ